MNALIKTALIGGGVIVVLGLLGTVMSMLPGPGTLAITGAILFAAGIIAKAITANNQAKS